MIPFRSIRLLLPILAVGVGCAPAPDAEPIADPPARLVSLDESVAAAQVDSLASRAPADAKARRHLIETMNHPARAIRLQAASALGQAGREGVASLLTALEDPRPLVQSAASFGLGELGTAAKSALPKLVVVLGGPDDSAAAMANWAIGEVAGERPPSRRIVLLQMLRFGPVPDRGDAVASIAAMGPSGLSYAPILVRMLSHPDPGLARAAADALIRIGPLVRPAIEAIGFRGDPHTQREARRILSALDPPL